MTKDEALDLALEALEESIDLVRQDYESAKELYGKYPSRQARLLGMEDGLKKHEEAITAIKQARALDKMADNARELGLDYETVDGTHVSKVWWDGEKLMAKPIPFVEFYRPVQQKPSCKDCRTESPCRAKGQDLDVCSVYVPPPAQEFVCSTGLCHYKSQREWVGLSEEEIDKLKHLIDWTATWSYGKFACEIERILKEKNA